MHVAAERHVAGLILQAPPAGAEEFAAWSSQHDVPRLTRGIAKVAIDPAVSPIYGNVREIAKVSSPLLGVQATEDDVVPIAQGREVFSASPAKGKSFVEVPGVRTTTTSGSDILRHGRGGDALAAVGYQRHCGRSDSLTPDERFSCPCCGSLTPGRLSATDQRRIQWRREKLLAAHQRGDNPACSARTFAVAGAADLSQFGSKACEVGDL